MRRFILHTVSFICFLGLGLSWLSENAAAQQISFSPSTLNFGAVTPGGSQTSPVQVTNISGGKINISQASTSGAGYSLSAVSYPIVLSPGQTMSLNVTFAPTSPGTDAGSVSIVSQTWAGNGNGNRKVKAASLTSNAVLPLLGSGLASGQLTISPVSYNFGNVNVGTNATMTGTLAASGSTVTIMSASSTNSGVLIGGVSFPTTLVAGQTIPFTVTFSPQAPGSVSGSISFVSNATNPSVTESVSGSGVTQGQLVSNPPGLSFGSLQVGTSKLLTGTLTNSGGVAVTISASSATGAGFSLSGLTVPLILAPGQSTSFALLFSPSATGVVSGSLGISSNGLNPSLSIPLSGTGVLSGTLSSSPTNLSFGTVQVGNTSSNFETLTNSGGSTVTISQASVTGAGFSVSGLTLPVSLAASQSITFSVSYAPASAGLGSGNLAVLSDASNSSLNIALAGTGAASGQLSVSPTALSFGNVAVGSNGVMGGSVNATGASVTISSVNVNSNEFALSGISLPTTIAAGQSLPFTVTFTPNVSGTASANLILSNNSVNSTVGQSLTGNGIAAIQHAVNLSWLSSASAVGYNVRRGVASGGPYALINSSLDPSTSFVDNTVVSGQTYYYVVTAVDGSSAESGYSNEVRATVPTP